MKHLTVVFIKVILGLKKKLKMNEATQRSSTVLFLVFMIPCLDEYRLFCLIKWFLLFLNGDDLICFFEIQKYSLFWKVNSYIEESNK